MWLARALALSDAQPSLDRPVWRTQHTLEEGLIDCEEFLLNSATMEGTRHGVQYWLALERFECNCSAGQYLNPCWHVGRVAYEIGLLLRLCSQRGMAAARREQMLDAWYGEGRG